MHNIEIPCSGGNALEDGRGHTNDDNFYSFVSELKENLIRNSNQSKGLNSFIRRGSGAPGDKLMWEGGAAGSKKD